MTKLQKTTKDTSPQGPPSLSAHHSEGNVYYTSIVWGQGPFEHGHISFITMCATEINSRHIMMHDKNMKWPTQLPFLRECGDFCNLKDSLEEVFVKLWVESAALPLCLLFDGRRGVRIKAELHIRVSQPIGVHRGKIPTFLNCKIHTPSQY